MIIIMIIILTTILYTIHFLTQHCKCINLIDVPQNADDSIKQKSDLRGSEMYEPYPDLKLIKKPHRRYWLVNEKPGEDIYLKTSNVYEDEKDANLKGKISALVDQTMQDAERQMKTVYQLKDQYREQSPYRAGFVLSLVKKSRDVLYELFNVAIKHRNEWKALEQLKIFELIVHTNVDTTNLLKQLVEIHLTHLNASSPSSADKRRVILI